MWLGLGSGSRAFSPSTWVLLAGLLVGCAPGMGGRASFPVVSKAKAPAGFEKVADVDEKRCRYNVLFFWSWGEDENHEALVSEILEKNKGDAIVDAELTFFYIPAILYNQSCAEVKGTVVRRSSGSAPAEPAAEAAPEKEASR